MNFNSIIWSGIVCSLNLSLALESRARGRGAYKKQIRNPSQFSNNKMSERDYLHETVS
jgi:hypothetical protein